ncbi:MAG: ECF transporter S component [Ruminococcaceae bacterium]|nr:ECF transporter S component [Oscillospiraceae bacterium]
MKNNIRTSAKERILRMVMIALFCALAFAVMPLFRINVVFLTFDIKDAIITIGGLLFGPLAAVVISAVTALLEFLTIGDTGVYGLLMDFVSSASFAVVAALIYRFRRDLLGAVVGLLAAVFSMTAIMLCMNLLIVPLYTPGVTVAVVAGMLPTLILPFNLTKAVLNAALVMILYKPVSVALRYARVKIAGASMETKIAADKKTNLLITVAGLALVAASLILFFVILGGEAEWFVDLWAE